ncbi:MAG TPA: glycosyltransferase family 1 protein [Chthoniobacteraceae bacterium]
MTRPLHIGLIAQGGANWMGGAEYIRNLTHAVGQLDGTDGWAARTSLIYGEKQRADWEDAEAPSKIFIPRRPREWPLLWRFIPRGNKHFQNPVERAKCDFIYPLSYDNLYNVDVKFPLGFEKRSFQWAGWIPDFQHRHLPDWFPAKELARRERGIAALVAEAPIVVLSSQTAAEDFSRFFSEAQPKARVLTFATHPNPSWYSDDCGEDLRWLPPRFFLVSNQFWKHKNHLLVFEALRILSGRGLDPVVVCTGQVQDFRDPDYANVILQSIHRYGLSGQILLLGLVPRRTQIEMMRRCLAVIQPSLFEGWSTVVEDARVLGKPAFLSDLAVHREQNPPGSEFFDAKSPEALADLLARAWDSFAPGPNSALEAAARERATERAVDFGRTFLEIAAQACG